MARRQRGRVYVRSADGSATTVSSRRGNFASKLCRKHRIANLRQAATIGLVPAFVDLDVLEREAGRVLRSRAFDRDADRRVRRTGKVHSERIHRARVAEEALRLRAAELGGVIEPGIDTRAGLAIAGRSLQVMTRAPIDVVSFELDQDLDVHTNLVFASDVTMATFGEVRIYRGAALVSTSSSFILRAASAQGNLLPVVGKSTTGISLNDHVLRI